MKIMSLGMRVAMAAAALMLSGCGGAGSVARSIEVGMKDIAYEPMTIQLRASEPVRLVFRNDGKLVHDFTVEKIPAMNVSARGGQASHEHGSVAPPVHLALAGGQSGEISLTPTEPGDYEYYCTEAGHREAGMHGILRVGS